MFYLLLLAFYRYEVVFLTPAALLLYYRLNAGNFLLLKLVLFCKRLALFRLLGGIGTVIAGVYRCFRVFYIKYLVCRAVKKISVV